MDNGAFPLTGKNPMLLRLLRAAGPQLAHNGPPYSQRSGEGCRVCFLARIGSSRPVSRRNLGRCCPQPEIRLL